MEITHEKRYGAAWTGRSGAATSGLAVVPATVPPTLSEARTASAARAIPSAQPVENGMVVSERSSARQGAASLQNAVNVAALFELELRRWSNVRCKKLLSRLRLNALQVYQQRG